MARSQTESSQQPRRPHSQTAPAGVDDHVAELGGEGGIVALVEGAVEDDAGADADVADFEEDEVVEAAHLIVAEPHFGQGGEVAVVIDGGGHAEGVLDAGRQGEAGEGGQ